MRDDEGVEFAIKYLSPENVTSDKTRRFKNELGFCIRNDHPNVVKVIDHGRGRIALDVEPIPRQPTPVHRRD